MPFSDLLEQAQTPTPLQKLNDPFLTPFEVEVFIKREDLIHPAVSGNKFRKLKYNLKQAKEEGFDTLLTFGGAYSNHIYATAAAGKIGSFKTIGIIRGEEHLPLNTTLSFAKSCGMDLHYLNRTTYRQKNSEEVIGNLQEKFGAFYLIPEGGSNTLAVKGCTEIIPEIDLDFDYIACACGTGGTLAGIIASLENQKKVIGFPALKGGNFLKSDIEGLIKNYNGRTYQNWSLQLDYHFGGYAKTKPDLLEFIKGFEERNQIRIEQIYTGKMLFGIYDLIQKGFFKKGERIIVIHTGGLQGRNIK